jgi:hypothetical protein
MNQENRNKVNNYLNSNSVESVSPLYFDEYESPKDEFDSTKYSVEDMCKRVLALTKIHASYNSESKGFECYSDGGILNTIIQKLQYSM